MKCELWQEEDEYKTWNNEKRYKSQSTDSWVDFSKYLDID